MELQLTLNDGTKVPVVGLGYDYRLHLALVLTVVKMLDGYSWRRPASLRHVRKGFQGWLFASP